MVAYKVDWGDAEPTVVSGVEMRDRPNDNNPHSLYHLYDYWDLKNKGLCVDRNTGNGVDECYIKPKVWIKDNWGWYSYKDSCIVNAGCRSGINRNEAPDAVDEIPEFRNWIVVKER